jgi:hypothetical protein
LTTDDPGQLEAARNVRDKICAGYEPGGALIRIFVPRLPALAANPNE